MGKESLGKGAKSAQTLYMTIMTASQKRRPAQHQAACEAAKKAQRDSQRGSFVALHEAHSNDGVRQCLAEGALVDLLLR